MHNFKMLVRDVDLAMMKDAAKADIAPNKLHFSINNEQHIIDDFWEIEILCEDMFQIFHLGRVSGYNQAVENFKKQKNAD